ncbi:MAG: FKBP-type peptidyl-prolyl cis-trans isomerase [Bacteroidales bacterium]|jgi:FKBP-type peptidyl-prolyl cis-trans isomerase|nr:FKBP-type peptidyl-prolyl cis-trans isomerase [Bacteroidales bacterium]
MKKILLATVALLMIASISTSCQRGELKGFKRTKTGLNYKFYVKTDSPKAKIGDLVIGEFWVYEGGELVFTNEGNPDLIVQVEDSHYPGDFMEAFRMMGAGDSVAFAFSLDTIKKYNPGMPPGDPETKYMHYTFKITGIYNEFEYGAKMEEDQITGEAEEAEKLEAYINEKGITVKPNSDGVYVIVHTRGNGAVAANEKTVSLNYIGSLVDGTVFDASYENIAQQHDIYNPQRSYEPLNFRVGTSDIIPGMANAVEGMRVGTKATLVIPSRMAYGPRTAGSIPAFATLIFDVEIVGVK